MAARAQKAGNGSDPPGASYDPSSPTKLMEGQSFGAKFLSPWSWLPPPHWQKITTIDTHTGGEPLRIIVEGLPDLGPNTSTVLAKRRYFMDNYDHIRTGLLLEPRGHADMYGAVITLSSDPAADFDVFFLNTDGYSPMCGHAILAITKVVLATATSSLARAVNLTRTLNINTPAGRIQSWADVVEGEIRETFFRNVPSFIYRPSEQVQVPGLGMVDFDIAFGGAFYAIVDAESLKVDLAVKNYTEIVDLGRKIKAAVVNTFPVEHPSGPELSTLFGVIFTGPPNDRANHSRNVNVFEEGMVDRSSTGTGVSARAALLYARGQLSMNETIRIESIIGSTMTVKVAELCSVGPHRAIVPEVGGQAWIVSQSTSFFDPTDPLIGGFMIR